MYNQRHFSAQKSHRERLLNPSRLRAISLHLSVCFLSKLNKRNKYKSIELSQLPKFGFKKYIRNCYLEINLYLVIQKIPSLFVVGMEKQQYVMMPVSHYWIICLYLLSRLLIFKHLFHWEGKKDKAISSFICCMKVKNSCDVVRRNDGNLWRARCVCFTLLSEKYL